MFKEKKYVKYPNSFVVAVGGGVLWWDLLCSPELVQISFLSFPRARINRLVPPRLERYSTVVFVCRQYMHVFLIYELTLV